MYQAPQRVRQLGLAYGDDVSGSHDLDLNDALPSQEPDFGRDRPN
jgi:hypothetical protein